MSALARISHAPPAPPFLGVARSAKGRRWVERLEPARAPIATAVAQRHAIPELLARVLVARGATLETAGRLLDPSLRTLMPDPSTLRDMDAAAERLATAIERREPMALFGDYDVDGAACLALMQRFLRLHGHAARLYVPDRLTEGYGPNPAAFARLMDEGATLILTLDCGTAAGEPLAAAAARGVDVVVVDHHPAGEALPPARAIVNPNRLDDLSGQGHLAAAGVTFLLLVATARVLRERRLSASAGDRSDLLDLLDLVALATVCDVVPLHGLNRAFVAKGLQVLARRRKPGPRALADAAGLAAEATPYTLGFVLGPRLNAGGRLDDPEMAARLLLTEDEAEAARIATVLERLNGERKAVEARMREAAIAQAERHLDAAPDAPVLVCGGDDWHKGVVGLVASRLVEKFDRPAIAVAWDGRGLGAGSARSVPGVDIGAAIRAAVEAGLAAKGGGHAMAAGLTVERARLASVTAFLGARLAAELAERRAVATLAIDGALMPAAATLDLLATLERAGPYGAGNPRPRFVLPAHRCLHVRPAGAEHLRCALVAADGARIDAVAFRAAGGELAPLLERKDGAPLHVAGHLVRDDWGGRAKVDFVIDDVADPRAQGR